MALFDFGKKKGCACSQTPASAPSCVPASDPAGSSVLVLGSGCASCHALLENTRQAVESLGLDLEVGYITDLEQIARYGVMRMPALVVNGKVVSTGKVLRPEQAAELLRQTLL